MDVNKIYNQDCLEAMKLMKDNEFDLAIVDPPYGIGAGGINFKNGTSKNKYIGYKNKDWDNTIPDKNYFIELFRVSKEQIIWGANYMTTYLPPSMGWIYWDKGTGENSYADGELAYSSFNRALRSYKVSWNGANANNGTPRIHPTEKPVKLYEWLLMNYAKKGDKILDTHLGSGSIAIACHNLGFDLTGYELDKEYYDNAIKRIKNHQAQLRIL